MKKYIGILIFTVLCLSASSCGRTGSVSDKNQKNESSIDTGTSDQSVSSDASRTTAATEEQTAISQTVTSAETKESTDTVKLIGTESAAVYEEININGFLTETNVIILNGDELLDTSDTGKKTVTVKYLLNGNELEKELEYTVEDTEAPVILNAGWNPYHLAGKEFDLNDYVGFADNYDSNPVLTYDGSIDPNTIGDYPLTAYVTDSSGNVTSWDITISVVNSTPVPPDDRERVNFSDFSYIYGGDGVRVGIDVSTWQGEIDWNAVRDAGCQFAIIRIGYSYGDIVMDDRFYDNIEGAKAAGIDLSVYFYTTANDEDKIREQAVWIAETLGEANTDLPIGFDWEEFGNFQKYGMSIKQINDLYALFHEEMAGYGYETMLYSSKNFLNNVWNEHSKTISPVWLAHYVEDTDYEGSYYIWQQSSCGRIPGIYGDVDMNIMYE